MEVIFARTVENGNNKMKSEKDDLRNMDRKRLTLKKKIKMENINKQDEVFLRMKEKMNATTKKYLQAP